MPNQNLFLDNDILIKISRYLLVPALLKTILAYGEPAILGSARFVVSHRIARSRDLVNKASVVAALEVLLKALSVLEPDDAEVLLAADFQEQAQLLNVALDPGESILLAILVLRHGVLLLTGDKRAIVAAEAVLKQRPVMAAAKEKVACLEQLLAEFLESMGAEAVRASVCSDPGADRTLSICFSCGSDEFSGASASAGLSSYVRNVRASAPTILVRSDDLSALLP